MFLVRFLPAVFVFGLAAAGYWLTNGGTRLPDVPPNPESWFVWDGTDEFRESTGSGLPDAALAELFRFDLRPRDLGGRWTGQSAGMERPVFQANLMAGDLAIDLTGSVLYHFTPQGQLVRVVVAGTTTQPRECAEYAADVFGFQPDESNADSAVFRGVGARKGLLRLASLPGEKNSAVRYRVEWTVER